MAQRTAEKAREYNERWSQAQEIEDRIEENAKCAREAYKAAREWVRGLRDSALSPVLCVRIKREIRKEWAAARQFVENVREDKRELLNYGDVTG